MLLRALSLWVYDVPDQRTHMYRYMHYVLHSNLLKLWHTRNRDSESMRHMLCYATMPWIDTVKWLAMRSQRAANDLSPQSWSWSAVGVEPLGLSPSAPLTPETHLLPEKTPTGFIHPRFA